MKPIAEDFSNQIYAVEIAFLDGEPVTDSDFINNGVFLVKP